MKKIKLYAVCNEKEFNFYTFDKTQETHKILGEVFDEIFKIQWPFVKETYDEDDDPISVKVDISKNKDFHERISGVGFVSPRIDVFYGDKRMFVTLYGPLDLRNKFNKKFKKIAIMPKSKKNEISAKISRKNRKTR
ncbi:MAG: hypothetical protein ACE5ES_05760 [Candidatus Nanoarchaeia archaeon]